MKKNIFLNLFKKDIHDNYSCSLHFLDENCWSYRNYINFARNGYIKNVIAFRAIHTIASSVSSIPLILKKNTSKGKITLHSHPLLTLLEKPNIVMSGAELLEGIISYKLIHGNSYVLMSQVRNDSAPKELHLLRPDRVEIVPGKNNIPLIYRYTVNNVSRDFRINTINNTSPVLHLKSFHPLDDWYGLSPIEAALYSIEQHNQAGAWNQAMLKNGARPSGALVVQKNHDGSKAQLSTEQYNRLKSQINEFYTGSKNAGKPLLLEGGLDWKEMSLSPKDMDFIESKHSSARDISLAFGVPPQLLGIPGDNTYSNLIEARLALWEQTIIPHLENLLSHLNHWLIPRFEKDLCLSYDKDSIGILLEKRQKLWQYVQNSSFMTINEKRAAFGLPKIKDGDRL